MVHLRPLAFPVLISTPKVGRLRQITNLATSLSATPHQSPGACGWALVEVPTDPADPRQLEDQVRKGKKHILIWDTSLTLLL